MKKLLIAVAIAGLAASACSSEADVAARNLSVAAEQFEVQRRVTFLNGITDLSPLVIEGRCSVETADSALAQALEVTCKKEDGSFVKHFLGLSDNMSFVVEQLTGVEASTSQYRFIIRPSALIPDLDVE